MSEETESMARAPRLIQAASPRVYLGARPAVWLAALALGLLAGFLAVQVRNAISPRPPDHETAGARPLDYAPDFEIPLYQGGDSFRLGDTLRGGRGVVINFWASWCLPCRQEMPLLEKTWHAYQERGVVFVGVNVWDTEAEARAFLDEFDISYPSGPDVDEMAAEAYRLRGVPTTIFITPDGLIRRTILGPVSETALVESVEAILP